MTMRLKLLFLVAGAVATPPLFPAPLVLVTGEDEGTPKISCIAPRRFAGSTFELFGAGAGMAVQSVTAAPDQHHAEFTLGGASRCYRCRYRSYNGSAWQTSEFSVETVVNASSDAGCHPATTVPTGQALPTSTALHQGGSWLLPVAVGMAGLALLLLLVAAVAVWRVEVSRRQAKRLQASCWTETRCPSGDFSYDNGSFTVGLNMPPAASCVTSTIPSPPPTTVAPNFSTFHSLA